MTGALDTSYSAGLVAFLDAEGYPWADALTPNQKTFKFNGKKYELTATNGGPVYKLVTK